MNKNVLTFLFLFFTVGLVGISQSAQMNLAGAWSFDEGSGKTAVEAL